MPSRGLGCTFYGTEGIGKTSFALQWPKPLSILSIRETGFEDLESIGEVPDGVSGLSFEEYAPLNRYIKSCEDATIVIDSLLGFQSIFYQHIINTQFEGKSNKFFSFQNGPNNDAPKEMFNFEALLNFKRNQGKHIVLLAHAKVDRLVNPAGADYLTYTLELDKGIRSCILKWSQATIFMNQEVNISTVTESFKGEVLEGKANDDITRLMYTKKANTHSAKNRLNLPTFINMGKSPQEAFNNFWSKVPDVFK